MEPKVRHRIHKTLRRCYAVALISIDDGSKRCDLQAFYQNTND
jgi:hypothetical protein